MKSKLRQIIYDMRHQPVIAWVTFLATAMSVFLIMLVMMIESAKTLPMPPESCRDRLLIGCNLHTENINEPLKQKAAGLSYSTAADLYGDLDGIERTTFFTLRPSLTEVYARNSDIITVKSRRADAEFFKIFDHQLIEGRYYTPDEANAMMPLAVVSESTARKTLGVAPWCGREIIVDNIPYTVVGVIRDNSSLATVAHGELFTPTGPNDTNGQWGDYMGSLSVAMIRGDGVDPQHIRDQVKGRYAILDAKLAGDGERTIYHEAPYDKETFGDGAFGSNQTPDPRPARRMRMIIYVILLIVPAINLSSMLHSRIRRRVNEIGVRRAFGCPRRRIFIDIVTENFLVTLAGGIFGVLLGLIFATSFSGLYVTIDNIGSGDTPPLSALLNWGSILFALMICFILNILSASVPAWQASRLNPVDALNSK